MSGRWMTLEDAFNRAVKIEGIQEIAFEKLFQSLERGHLESRAFQNRPLYDVLELEDRPVTRDFRIGRDLWQHLFIDIENGKLNVRDLKDIPGPEDDSDGERFVEGLDRPFYFDEWQIAISTTSFEDVFLPTKKAVQVAVPATTKAGGRTATHDWAGAGAYAAVYVVENEYPQTRSDLVKIVQDWFATEGKVPDKRQIERFVATMYETNERLKSGRRKT